MSKPYLKSRKPSRMGTAGGALARRAMLWASMSMSMSVAMPADARGFDPSYATIPQLRDALDAGRLSSEELVRYYLQRIERLDRHGPRINALLSLNPHAIDEARRRDAEGRNKSPKAPLYGIPFIAKDNFDTAGLPTSGGSAALKTSMPPANAWVIQKLLDQGAILIGKANMSELAASYGRLGYSSAGGQTANPYNTARDASGSSSGSAAALAADFAAFALGTDTTGSVRAPASVTGLVGLRPTLGLVSRGGIIPLSLTFDTPGVLTRRVRDAAIVLDAIAGVDPRDAATLPQPARSTTYAGAAVPQSIRGVRLGIIGAFRGANAEIDALEQASLSRLKARGAVLVPVTLPAEFATLWGSVLGPVGEAEFKPQFERYLRALPPAQPHTLAEFIRISESGAVADSPTPVNPQRLQALRDANRTRLTDSPNYIDILTRLIPALRRQLQALMAENDLQALAFSTMSCPASPRFDREDRSYVCHSDDPYKPTYIAAVAGFPEITVPAGQISGNLPVGYSLLGPPYGEARLLGLAAAFESARPPLPPPPLH